MSSSSRLIEWEDIPNYSFRKKREHSFDSLTPKEKEKLRNSMCTGKSQLSKWGAQKVKKTMEAKYKVPFNTYACPFCNTYHVGNRQSNSERGRRKRRNRASKNN